MFYYKLTTNWLLKFAYYQCYNTNFFDKWLKKNQNFQNFIKQQKFHQFFSYKISPHFIFCPKNDGFLGIFSFLLLRPSKSSGVLKKDPTFVFSTFEYALKNQALGRPFFKYCPVSAESTQLTRGLFFNQYIYPLLHFLR